MITLGSESGIKDLRVLKYFLVIEVTESKQGIFISHQKYVLDLVEEIWMLACKTHDRIESQNWWDPRGVLADKGRYRCSVGRLIFLSHTHHDIAYFSVVSQFLHAPRKSHMDAVYHILLACEINSGQRIVFFLPCLLINGILYWCGWIYYW